MDDLPEWLEEQRVMRAFLDRTDSPGMRQAWALAVCDLEAVPLLDDVERADDAQWQALRSFLLDTRAEMTEQTWSTVRAESRVKVWLAVHDHRAALEQFVAHRLFEFGNRRTEVVTAEDGARVVRARFDGLFVGRDDLAAAMPDDLFEMTERETPLHVHLQAARWRDPTHLVLETYVFAQFVGDGGVAPRVTAALVHPGTGERLPLAVEPFVDPEVTVHAGHRYQDYAHSAVRLVLDATSLPSPGDEPVAWGFEVTLGVLGLTRTGGFGSREDRTSAGLLGYPVLAPRTVGDLQAGLRAEPRKSLSLVVSPAPGLRLVECASRGRTVTGALAVDSSLRSRLPGLALVATGPDGLVASCAPVGSDDGATARFSLRLPAPTPTPSGQPAGGRWSLRAVDPDGELPLGFPAGVPERFVPGTTDAEVVAGRGSLGFLELAEAVRTLLVDDVTLVERGVRVQGRWIGRVPPRWQVTLATGRARLSVEGVGDGPAVDVTVSTVWDEWGLGETSIPAGAYQVVVDCPGGTGSESARVLIGEGLLDRLLRSTVGPDFRMAPLRTPRGLAVRLTPPLTDDERGPFRQRVLQEWSSSDELSLDPASVYLQSYTGAPATDSQRAIHDELRRSRPDLTLHWAVASPSTPVPEGAVPVLMHTREWYRVLGTATYLVNNIDFDRWFRTKPGQRFLQTFHGYPAKSMGIRLWRAKQFTPRRIELELGRTSRDWDLILTPAPEMDVHYRVEYDYDGEIESSGYPRDDALLAPDADEVRERTRRLLGIAPHQTVVLYAPTWRDDQATNYRSATMTRHLDLESATTHLGEEFVFLMRGHRFHAQGTDRSGRTARLIDVTDYPEINDLILASDAAVLDYSSLRFDFALTGRPMLFLVPDLGAYTGGVRGFLYPFEDSAPGPLLDDAEEVIAALRDLPAVRRKYAAAYETFNRTYNYLQDGQAAKRVVQRFFG